MVKIHISGLLGERRWIQADLVRKIGIRPNTIFQLYNEVVDRVYLNHIDVICNVLDSA